MENTTHVYTDKLQPGDKAQGPTMGEDAMKHSGTVERIERRDASMYYTIFWADGTRSTNMFKTSGWRVAK